MNASKNAGNGRFTLFGFAKTAWKQPHQLWLRKAFFQIHLWAGVLLALYIIAIGISGSILVFKDELTPRPHLPQRSSIPANCTPLNLLDAMDSASQSHPRFVLSLALCPIEANRLYAIALHSQAGSGDQRGVTVYIDPQDFKVAGEIDQNATWLAKVEHFHLELLLKNHGRQWNGAAAAIFLLLVLTGVVLWWPGVRHWRRAFKVDLRRTWKRINWDLHHAIGIWTVFFTLIWAVTGIYFAWEAPFEAATNRVSQIRTAAYPEAELRTIAQRTVSLASPTLNLLSVLADAQHRSPGSQLEGIYFGSGTRAVLTVYMARARLGDYTQTDFLYFDQRTGDHLLTWHRGQNETLGDWMLWLLVPLHFGTSLGFPGKLVWCAFGLTLPILAITGALMYWNRYLRRVVMS